MSDTVVDSSVVAKWILPEPDSAQSKRFISEVAQKGERLIRSPRSPRSSSVP
jgi:hypothetical protein